MIDDYSTLKYTICFIKQGNKLLMLNRNFKPNMGLWNGVGGKVDDGETPLECILREVYEETGIKLDTAVPKGVVSWQLDRTELGGMYVFVVDLPDKDCLPQTPVDTVEGILDWKEITWVLHANNFGIAENIPLFFNFSA